MSELQFDGTESTAPDARNPINGSTSQDPDIEITTESPEGYVKDWALEKDGFQGALCERGNSYKGLSLEHVVDTNEDSPALEDTAKDRKLNIE